MDDFVFGEIVKTRGLHGCVKALSFLESAKLLEGLKFVCLESASGLKSRHEIKKITSFGKFLFIEFTDISNADLARKLVGSKLLMPRDRLESLPADEYYWHDIIGLEVYAQEGRHLGRIEAIFPTGSNDVYVCRGDHGEILIPATAGVVEQVDVAGKKMIVNLLKGLLP
ncbi:MAG: 16S rRNA processing protein RimM [Smithella sp.]|jgi:16S rRNA processing protein RimM|nr:ribosome maturation factor RimM [Smithellaceae bacterium]NLA41021.1 16S rRNA processing protein RimM [Smithella sp.]